MLRASRSDAGPTSAPFKERALILSTDYRFYTFNLDQLTSEQTKCCPVDLEDGDTRNSMVSICPLIDVRHMDTVYRAVYTRSSHQFTRSATNITVFPL
jgi:hypothetical protein